ncbi:immunity 26/phosphotriesterase HocA family protein [Rossellomorea sp. SC111]|uniref:immunity 26/phosphotriesterase HocA family protein n=1 Tax=Rossellomorea sp. SC111 TaxID=2968985 RepID=UPI00215A7360|nr:immunity 26/phosphotriesterase HocA family protein [Rossellomorea sp. SC111]MCR8847776.1 immunity 26/phosphotriesterase HocA family protein [Rossellomorea sp. SC111]
MKRQEVKKGDIFTMKIHPENNLYAYGQVISLGDLSDCLIAYDLINSSSVHPSLGSITSAQILFVIQTVTSRIEDGLWEIIGNENIPTNFVYPQYRMEVEDGYELVNYRGELLRELDEESAEGYKDFESWSPVSLENALKAKYVTDWDPYYDELIYSS